LGQTNPHSGVGCGASGFGSFTHEETEGAVGGFGDAYAWGGLDFGGTVAVVDDPDGGGGRGYVEAVRVFAGDVECLAETARASGEEFGFCVVGEAAEIGHGFKAVNWIESSDEDSACFAGTMRGDVEAVVHAVDEVDIYVSGWAEEYCVAGSKTVGRVGCRVDEAEVGFDFGDAGGEAFALEIADEELAEEGSGYGVGGAGVEATWEEFRGVTGLWGCAHIF
jgi:hypothetical protein